MMRDEFDRIKRLPPYVFAEVNKLKAELRAKGKDIIDLEWVILICLPQSI
jgi:alanine-synthesizing transaminase